MTYLVDANVLSEPTKPAPSGIVYSSPGGAAQPARAGSNEVGLLGK